MDGHIQFIGPEFERDWSIDNFDPSLISRLKSFFNEANAAVGDVLPTTVVITNKGEPTDIMVSEEATYLNVHALDHLGEPLFRAALTHESAHIKFGDSRKLGNTLHSIGRSLSGIKDLHEVFIDSPSSCCGIIIEKFGGLDVFEQKLRQAFTATKNVRAFFSQLDIAADTKPSELANRLIGDEKLQQALDNLGDQILVWKSEETKDFYDNFFAQTIAARKDRSKWYNEFVDFEALLPTDKLERKSLINGLTTLHQEYILPSLAAFEKIEAIEPVLLKAVEHRADNEACEKCGPEAVIALIDLMRQHCKSLPEEEKQRYIQEMEAEHPSFDERESFIKSRATVSHASVVCCIDRPPLRKQTTQFTAARPM